MSERLHLGDMASDIISGAKGVVIARAEYLFDSPSVLIAPASVDEHGRPDDTYWITENRLRRVGAGVVTEERDT